MMFKRMLCISVAVLGLSACSMFEPWEEENREISEYADAVSGAVYKVEKKYEINGVWYYPTENYQYSQQGLASWYVPEEPITANGEQYVASAVTARHKTLPLPSIVRITNLENGKVVIARVNDRGPMVNNRLIDVSQKGAELLELPETGTAAVKVEILPEESKAVKNELVQAGRVWSEEIVPDDLDLVPPMPVPQEKAIATSTTQEVVYERHIQPKTATGGVYVRLGAFGNSANAAKAERSANTIAGNAVLDTTVRNGQTLQIVKAGPFATADEANAALAKLRKMGYRDAYVTK